MSDNKKGEKNHMRGKTKTAGGYKWMYKSDYKW